jgi:zinc transporter, ZIP family
VIGAFLWGALAASALLIGYLLAGRGLANRTIGLVMAFGAGALISSIAYELVPKSSESAGAWRIGLGFVLGALVYFGGDWYVDHRGGANRKAIAGSKETGSGAAIFLGSLLDAIPESIVLGIGLALGGGISVAFLVAVFISNLPEGLAGTVNMTATGRSRRSVLWMWLLLVLASAAFAAIGYGLIQWIPSADGVIVQAFAAGAMLTMLADAMMPEAFEHGGKLVGLVTVLGFFVAAALSVLE